MSTLDVRCALDLRDSPQYLLVTGQLCLFRVSVLIALGAEEIND